MWIGSFPPFATHDARASCSPSLFLQGFETENKKFRKEPAILFSRRLFRTTLSGILEIEDIRMTH